jgi:hypothetical protein
MSNGVEIKLLRKPKHILKSRLEIALYRRAPIFLFERSFELSMV